MVVFIYGSFIFALAFVFHIIGWKIYLPKRQTKALLLLFFGVFLGGLYLIDRYPLLFSFFDFSPPDERAEYVQIGLYLISLTLAYMITYSAIEADSPSLLILLLIHDAGTSGLTREELRHNIDDRLFVEPRVNDLLRDKMIVEKRGKYQLVFKGILMARLFIGYRNLMGAGKGG